MKLTLVLFLIVTFGAAVFAQNGYIRDKQDVGLDIVLVSVETRLLDDSFSNKPIQILKANARLVLIKRSEPKSTFLRVADIFTLKQGWVRARDVKVFFLNRKKY